MTCQTAACRWAWCPGCGKERRLARGREAMRAHNRWDPAACAMVPCGGSGQLPRRNGHAQATAGTGRLQQTVGDAAAAQLGEGAA
jgi:hypothetical protein